MQQPAPQEIQTGLMGVNFLIGVFGVLIFIGVIVLTLMVKKRDILQDTNEKLIKARDLENADCEKRCEQCKTDLTQSAATIEALEKKYRLMSSDVVSEVLAFAEIREIELSARAKLESQVRILQRRLDHGE